MTLLIVEYIPYVAFTAAAAMVAWVVADVLRGRKRAKAPEATQDSGRGLAGPAEPLQAVESETVAEVVAEVLDETPELAPPEELELPVSQAQDLAPDEAAEELAPEEAAPEAEFATDDMAEEGQPSDDAPVVAAEVIPVRRDPSVRVFDTAVAASERKVMSPDD
jgi:hypothetical protein